MVQALIQLVDNSIKHTVESDSIVIGCRLNKNEIEFFVGDSGPGIPLEARGEVQERFVRGGWTSQDSEGSGLGLTIVSAIAKGHQGSVFIGDSILGGAEVGITVPWTKDI
jgi:signal transduction histidine kinase